MATIRKLLIANRGEIACRIMRTCRAMGIETVAVYSEPDADAVFVHEADEAIALGGTTPATSYLRVDAILDAAARSGADAVHPGYGFLSENAGFAQACIDAGLTWVGPSPSAIAAMGSKLAARDLMSKAGVAVVPGVDLRGTADADVVTAVASLGLPLMVKASAGGGGRGMRVVTDGASLLDALASARREAASAFGDDTVFVERYIERPRHIEIQVFGDSHGNVVSLFERECSIQRRHQKIIEEAPSSFVTPALRATMGEAAIAAARAVGYVGAGTVEFIVAPDGTFYFLEMNTRLQVEHPVTECVTGLDLVRLQLLVAEGLSLPAEALAPILRGHAIEARLYAEDPTNDYVPSPGRIHRLEIPNSVRVDSGFASGDVVSAHYDPMLAKVIAYAPTRAEARSILVHALRRARVDGIVTNRELLVGVLEHHEFIAGETDTGFLDRHPPRSLTAGYLDQFEIESMAVAAAFAQRAAAQCDAPVLAGVARGFRNNRAQLATRSYGEGSWVAIVGYSVGRGGRIEVNGESRDDIEILHATPTMVDLVIKGVRRRVEVDDAGSVVYVATTSGSTAIPVLERFPRQEVEARSGSLVAPMPGTVVRVDAVAGAPVAVGAVLVVLEAMKMEHTITAPIDGLIAEVYVTVGQVVDAGTVLIVVAEADAP